MLVELDISFLCKFLRVFGFIEIILILETVAIWSNLNVHIVVVGCLAAHDVRARLREHLWSRWQLLTLLICLIVECRLLWSLADLGILNASEIMNYLQIVAIPILESVEGLGVAVVFRIVLLGVVLYPGALRVLV